MREQILRGVVLAMAVTAFLPATANRSANADEAAKLGVELNKIEPSEDGCRLSLVLRNKVGQAMDGVLLDLFFFDKKDIIASRLVVNAGSVPTGKTLVKIFDMPSKGCDELGWVLLNDATHCGPAADPAASCVGTIELSSKAPISLRK